MHGQSRSPRVEVVIDHSVLDSVGSSEIGKEVPDECFNSLVDGDSDGTDEHDAEDGNDKDYDGEIGSEDESEYGWTDDSRPQKRQRSSTLGSEHCHSIPERRSECHKQRRLLSPHVSLQVCSSDRSP